MAVSRGFSREISLTTGDDIPIKIPVISEDTLFCFIKYILCFTHVVEFDVGSLPLPYM